MREEGSEGPITTEGKKTALLRTSAFEALAVRMSALTRWRSCVCT